MSHAICATVAAVAASLLLTAPAVSATAGADAPREQDRAEIAHLMWNYSRAVDTLNPDAYVAQFTPDGAFGAVKGREALHKMIADLKQGEADREAKGEKPIALYHAETNDYLEFTGPDRARLHYYWMTLFGGGPDPKNPPRLAAVGHGVDDLVRVNGRWLIQLRTVSPKDGED